MKPTPQNTRKVFPVVTCRICSTQEEAHYFEPTKSHMVLQSLCFHCLFWSDLIKVADHPNMVRVKAVHYQVCGDEGGGRAEFRGFGGRHFTIRFDDGRTVQTNNLWCQGGIPERFRQELPDNARFVTEAVKAPSVGQRNDNQPTTQVSPSPESLKEGT